MDGVPDNGSGLTDRHSLNSRVVMTDPSLQAGGAVMRSRLLSVCCVSIFCSCLQKKIIYDGLGWFSHLFRSGGVQSHLAWPGFCFI